MRRILLVLAVAVVMAAMMAVRAMPAVAAVFPKKPDERQTYSSWGHLET